MTKGIGEPKASKRKESKKPRKRYAQTIFYDWCKSCGLCWSFCLKKVISPEDGGRPVIVRPEDCNGCRFCELRCPDFAITILECNAEGEENRS